MSKFVFDVVSEDPEVEHVPEKMQPAPMHEHGREDSGGIADWI